MRENKQLTKEVTSATIGGNYETHEYDSIGNSIIASFNGATNTYSANNLNQYISILRTSAPPREPAYDIDGNMLSDGVLSFTYDAANRLKTVSTNGIQILANFYDAKSRRVKKVTSEATTTFFYDDWNLIKERVACTNGTTLTIRYYWGKDLSGDLQGAGGVGGLLYLTVDGSIYIPTYDNNGNVTRYLDSSGNTVALYTYDAFGNIISKSGPLADFFRHRFSTKYYDAETGLYYYGYRFYHPILMRWLNRDPIEEDGGGNLYGICKNNAICHVDNVGLKVIIITDTVPSRVPNLKSVVNGKSIDVRAKTVIYGLGSFKVICKKDCTLAVNGLINLWIEMRPSNDPMWSKSDGRYKGSDVVGEENNAKRHEMDHFRTWESFLTFVETANSYTNKKYPNCKEKAKSMMDKYQQYRDQTAKHSKMFDKKEYNSGNQYVKHPLDTSSFSWE